MSARAGVLAVAVGLPALAGALAVALARRRFTVVVVRGESMLPTLPDGQRVLIRRCGVTSLRPDDLAVFRDPRDADRERLRAAGHPVTRLTLEAASELLIKRVVAVGGDPVPRDTVPALAHVDHDRVPATSFVVLGDNPGRSDDSRRYGYVPADKLVGTVIRRLA